MSPSDVAAPLLHLGTAPCAPRQVVGQFGGARTASTRDTSEARRGEPQVSAPSTISLSSGLRGGGRRVQESLGGSRVPLLMPMRYHGAWGGEAGRRHVSSSACQCKARLRSSQRPTGRKRQRFAAFLGEVLAVPPPPPPQPIIYNTHPNIQWHPGPQTLHNFTCIKGGWNLPKTQILWTRLYPSQGFVILHNSNLIHLFQTRRGRGASTQ